jgi:hypothetical protein
MASSRKKSRAGKSPKRAAARKPRGSARVRAPARREPDCCKRLEKRIRALERQIASGTPGFATALAANAPAFGQPPGVSVLGAKQPVGAVVDVGLAKEPGSPSFVRISLDSDPNVIYLAAGAPGGGIPGVAVGTFVIVKIEVSGDPGQTATVKVSKGVPNIVITVPATGHIIESQYIFVTG